MGYIVIVWVAILGIVVMQIASCDELLLNYFMNQVPITNRMLGWFRFWRASETEVDLMAGWRLQNGRIFKKKSMGVAHFQSKNLCCRLRTLLREVGAWTMRGGGGGKGRLELFRKLSHFGDATCPSSRLCEFMPLRSPFEHCVNIWFVLMSSSIIEHFWHTYNTR